MMNQDWLKEFWWWQRWWQKAQKSRTLHDNKNDDLKNQRMSSRLNQVHFKDQEESWIQESIIKFQESRSKFKNQEKT